MKSVPARTADNHVNVIIETPKGSTSKFKFDPHLDAMVLSRPLPAGIAYPYDWGFIPATRGADGDPLDAMVLWEGGSYPGVVIPCRLIGMLEVEQTNIETGARERNDRVIGVPVKSVVMASVSSIFELSERTRSEVETFFDVSVKFEGKELLILGWAGVDQAEALLR